MAYWCEFPPPELLETAPDDASADEFAGQPVDDAFRDEFEQALAERDPHAAICRLETLFSRIPGTRRNARQEALLEVLLMRSFVACDGLWGTLGSVGLKGYAKFRAATRTLEAPALASTADHIAKMLAEHGIEPELEPGTVAGEGEAKFCRAVFQAEEAFGDMDHIVSDGISDAALFEAVARARDEFLSSCSTFALDN